MSQKAIIYTRVSTEEQKENGFSLQEQEARLRKSVTKDGNTIDAFLYAMIRDEWDQK